MATDEAALGKLVVLGVGLIGGSFALALKQAEAVQEVVGVGRDRGNLDAARNLGIADRSYTLGERWTAELVDADLVLLATPVGQMAELFAAIAPALGSASVVTDVGSTKQDVIAAARANLGAALPRFVPGHPIAGAERSGASAAFPTLFRQRTVVLTPIAETASEALARVRACWLRCGALVQMLDPARHDAILAAVSHLPHVLAYALMAELSARPDAAELLDHAGTGFRDFTRLAASHPSMWRDVCLANRAALRRELAIYRDELERIEALIAHGDGDALQALFERARAARAHWRARSAADAPD
ncbi:MAG TPA: prephenate dehydrogenase/arogenate dehydrogenase family protein [Casimicrobiaceae bacterium]|nr:prephenate dehydrogenase/arogenate dehydrogenase family protein [Casimicrobiaceae bacterium]